MLNSLLLIKLSFDTVKPHLLVSKNLFLEQHFLLQCDVLLQGHKHLKIHIYNGNTDNLK